MLSIKPPFPIFTDTGGQPLEDGFIYIGVANQDPVTNPITVYWDEALSIPASQPIRTLAGYPSRAGTPANLYVPGDYSVVIKDKNNALVYQTLNVQARYGAEFVSYLPAGSGAVQTNVQAKLRETVSVIDYGADPAGLSDSATAFSNAAAAHPGAQIFVPAGTYLIGSTITIDTTGLGDTSVTHFVGAGMYQTVIDNQTGGPAFWVTSGTGAEFAYGFGLSHLSITDPSTTAGTIGVRIDGCRFVTLDNVRIDGMSSHGIYGLSSVGDFTDTSSVEIRQCQVENCGGYGVYASTAGNAIQYSWNLYECRIGLNTLGGVLWESMVNASMAYCGIYYNSGFGVRVTSGSAGAPVPKQIHIDHCEFDTNDGVQIDLVDTYGALITTPYLIANAGIPTVYTKGIVVGASCNSTVIEQAAPRWAAALTGLVGMEFASGSTDNVARDTIYAGFSSLVGDMYVDNSNGQLTIDDVSNRNQAFGGTWTVSITDQSGNTAPQTATGYYAVAGAIVSASFRLLDNIDTSGLVGTDLLLVTLPIQCKTVGVAFAGSATLTDTAGTPYFPTVSNGSTKAQFVTATNSSLLVSGVTSGTTDIPVFTLTYQRD